MLQTTSNNSTNVNEAGLNAISIVQQQRNIDNPNPDNSLSDQEKKNLFQNSYNKGRFDSHIHKIVCLFLYFVGAALMIMLAVRGWHFIAPDKWKWLTNDQCHEIERIIFSGAIITVIGKLSTRYSLKD